MPETEKDSIVDTDLARLLFVGKIADTFKVLDQEVELESLDSDTLREIAVRCSGLDVIAREQTSRIMSIAHSLKRVGRYTFKSYEEALKFVRLLQDPVLDLFLSHYIDLRRRQRKVVEDLEEELKKSQATSLPEVSGESSKDSQVS